jgi:hypothetical protein
MAGRGRRRLRHAGMLDFTFNTSSAIPSPIPQPHHRIELRGYVTDVYYITGPVTVALNPDGTVAPISVDRNAGGVPGRTVSFNFAEGSFPRALSPTRC